jgi:hypothetical protein
MPPFTAFSYKDFLLTNPDLHRGLLDFGSLLAFPPEEIQSKI